MNLAVHARRVLHQGEEQPDTNLFFRATCPGSFYIMLFVGKVGGKKRIVGGRGGGGN